MARFKKSKYQTTPEREAAPPATPPATFTPPPPPRTKLPVFFERQLIGWRWSDEEAITPIVAKGRKHKRMFLPTY